MSCVMFLLVFLSSSLFCLSIHFILSFFQQHHVHVLGAVWNRIPAKISYHTFDTCRALVTQYFHTRLPTFGVYGHIPLIVQKTTDTVHDIKTTHSNKKTHKTITMTITMTMTMTMIT